MTEQKHTNWKATSFADGSVGIHAATEHGHIEIAVCKGRFAHSHARLIAAAPDLLEMLKVAQLWLDVDGRYDMQGINAAIAKATGSKP